MRALVALALAALPVGVFVASATLAAGERFPPIDDALIHVRYAEAIAEGRPWGYVPGDALSTGATSLLWPWVLAPFAAAGVRGLDLWTVAVLLSALGSAVALDATARWAGRCATPAVGWLAAGALALAGPWVWGVASGMEVAWFGAALAVVVDRVTLGGDLAARDRVGLAAVAVLAATRPEGALLAAGLVGTRALVRGEGAPARAEWVARAWPWALAVGAGAVQPLVHLALRGQVVGSSVLAKQGRWPPLPWDERPAFMGRALLLNGYGETLGGALGVGALLLTALGVLALARARRVAAATLLGVVLLPLPVVAGTASVLVHHARYLQPFMVLVVPLGVLGAWALASRLPARPALVAGVLVALGLAPRAVELPAWARTYAADARAMAVHDGWAARALLARMAPGDVVAVNDIGAIGQALAAASPPRRVLDLEGIATERALPWAAHGEGSILALLRRERPRWAAVFPAWFGGLARAGVFVDAEAREVPAGSISGGGVKIVARVDLARADAADGPPALAEGERVLDTLALCDLLDEGAHAFDIRGEAPRPATGVRLGLDARDAEVLDGVRWLPSGASFTLRAPSGDRGPARVVMRVAGRSGHVQVAHAQGRVDVDLPDTGARGFAEVSVPVDAAAGEVRLALTPLRGVPVIARMWLVR